MEGRSVALPGGREPSIFTCARLHAGVVRGSKHFEHLHHIVQPVVAELVEDEREERDARDQGEDQLGVLLHLAEKRVIRRSSLCTGHSDLKQAERGVQSRSGCLPFPLPDWSAATAPPHSSGSSDFSPSHLPLIFGNQFHPKCLQPSSFAKCCCTDRQHLC